MADNGAPRTALVTGASRGIGAAIALRLGMAGIKVAVTARTLDPHPKTPGTLRDTIAAIEGAGGEAVAIVADVNTADDRARMVDEAQQQLGEIDILVNNAGVLFAGPNLELPDKRLTLMYEVLVHAPFDLSQRIGRTMADRGRGWILNISSVGALQVPGPPFERRPPGMYGAFKRAVEGMTNAFAAELYPRGVAVNSLAPTAVVPTPGYMSAGSPSPEVELEPPEIIAEAALALCSGDPAVLTNRIVFSQAIVEELALNPQPLPPLPGQFGN
jgi:citronellol/citronellal dehydrogenase